MALRYKISLLTIIAVLVVLIPLSLNKPAKSADEA